MARKKPKDDPQTLELQAFQKAGGLIERLLNNMEDDLVALVLVEDIAEQSKLSRAYCHKVNEALAAIQSVIYSDLADTPFRQASCPPGVPLN